MCRQIFEPPASSCTSIGLLCVACMLARDIFLRHKTGKRSIIDIPEGAKNQLNFKGKIRGRERDSRIDKVYNLVGYSYAITYLRGPGKYALTMIGYSSLGALGLAILLNIYGIYPQQRSSSWFYIPNQVHHS